MRCLLKPGEDGARRRAGTSAKPLPPSLREELRPVSAQSCNFLGCVLNGKDVETYIAICASFATLANYFRLAATLRASYTVPLTHFTCQESSRCCCVYDTSL